jgi:uncharacterized protein (TIGR03067 family)
MRSIGYILLMWVPLVASLGAAGQEPPKGDLATLQGSWCLRGYECEMRGSGIDPGGPQPPADLLPLLSAFGIEPGGDATVFLDVRDKYMTPSRGLVARQPFELHLGAEKDPKAIDLMFRSPSGPKKALLGIYRLGEDQLTVCVALGDQRPTECKATAGQLVLHYERSR